MSDRFIVRKISLLSSAALVLASTAMLPAYAQDAAGQGADTQIGEEIVVTGSRIARPDLTSPSPVQIVGSADIDSAGVVNIQDVLLDNPIFGAPAISRTNSNFGVTSAGTATVDLRNLGTDRTLVLVNGRRFVAGIPVSSTVDLNTIPTQLIQRVDVLSGGASSAVYGSDAVAGVVNIILKNDFKGLELEGRKGISEEGDSEETDLALTIGANFDGGKGNVVAHASYSRQGAVFSRDRARSAIDQISVGAGLTGDPDDILTVQTPFFSSFAPQGRFFAGSSQFTFNPNNTLLTGFSTNGSATRAADGFNRSAFRTIAIPTERFLIGTTANYEVSKNLNFFLEGNFAATSTTTELEPFPINSDDIFPATAGSFNIESESFAPDPANPGRFIRTVVRNPLVPQAIFDAATDSGLDADTLRDISFTRRLSEIGNRGNTADRNTFRILAGAKGDVPFLNNFTYEAYYSYGQTTESQISNGQFNAQNFANALDVVPDVNDINRNGSTTDPICRSATARAQGCVPANVFGFNSLSPEAVNYLAAPSLLATFTSQEVAAANITGKLFALPAGDVGLSLGAEYRKERSRTSFDSLQQAGLNGGNITPPTAGSFNVKEAFGEILVPLLKDIPGIQELTFNGAVRFSDYSSVGSTFSYNASLVYAPIEDIRFRVTQARSVRAPNVGELFGSRAQNFPAGLIDPCVGVTATTGGTRGTVCRSFTGVNENIATNGSFTLNQADAQGISTFEPGNPNLREEKSDTFSAGVVINPRSIEALRGFTLSVDYFNIEIDDAIIRNPGQFVLDQCFNQGVQSLCQLIRRRPTAAGPNSAGSIDNFDRLLTNSGGFETSGIDVTAAYNLDLDRIGLGGNLNTTFTYTYLIKGFSVPMVGSDPDPFEGEIGASRNRFLLTVNYANGPFSINLRTTYIGKAFLDDQFLASFDLEPEAIGFGAEVYNDLQLRFEAGKNIELTAGVNNLFNNDPPAIITGLPGNDTGTETAAGVYDAIGRTFYLGAKFKF